MLHVSLDTKFKLLYVHPLHNQLYIVVVVDTSYHVVSRFGNQVVNPIRVSNQSYIAMVVELNAIFNSRQFIF